jgi:DNA repair protein RecN (Recombination protein N)
VNSPVPAFSTAIRRLERRHAQAPMLVEPAVKALDAALTAMEDARVHLELALQAANYDPLELERIEERLFALRAAGRKYNSPVDHLAALAQKYAADLALIDAGAEQLARLEKAVSEADAKYRTAAQKLSAARNKAAGALDKAVNAEIKPLKLERATFTTQVQTDSSAPGPNGIDRVEFWAQTNPGTRPGPLMKVASGGELARFLLALKVVLADRGSAPTLIFDEIDTGVGGAMAEIIGRKIRSVAQHRQVLCITHLPQIAVFADQHFKVEKFVRGERTLSRVRRLSGREQREEIARMLGGLNITAKTRAAARELLHQARRVA